jgi:peptidylprolyl isomerase domain and WD repeat-containing protein 1
VRVFHFASGKLRRSYDESLSAANEVQRGASDAFRLDPIDFGRRVAAEREALEDDDAPPVNAVFDDSGNFILYSTLLGIKVRWLGRWAPGTGWVPFWVWGFEGLDKRHGWG